MKLAKALAELLAEMLGCAGILIWKGIKLWFTIIFAYLICVSAGREWHIGNMIVYTFFCWLFFKILRKILGKFGNYLAKKLLDEN